MMTNSETWFANRNFKGLDANGKPKDFTLGDPIPNVQNWPTFVSLRNTNWIVAASPLKTSDKVEKPKPVEKKAETKVVAAPVEKTAKPAKVKQEAKAVEAKADDLTCTQCAKEFKSSRALKVHLRYH